MKISYGITVHNEAEELKRLLNILIEKIDKELQKEKILMPKKKPVNWESPK